MGLRLTLLGFPENTTPELLLGIAGYFIRQDASSTLILSIALWRTERKNQGKSSLHYGEGLRVEIFGCVSFIFSPDPWVPVVVGVFVRLWLFSAVFVCWCDQGT